MIETVQSVDRTLTILEALSNHYDGLGITEISNLLDLHKSTVHRLLATLLYKGYVIKDIQSNRYRLSLKLYELGSKIVVKMNILKASKPYTEELMNIVNEVVHLVIRDRNDIIYIDKVEADNTISMASTIGRRSPLYCTSVGKAMMAHLTDREIKDIWDGSDIQKLTKHTITNFGVFQEELNSIRDKGYAVDNEENELGVRCIGAAVFNMRGEVEGAISISGPTNRILKKNIEEYGIEVKKYANLISKELGYNKEQ